MEKNRSTKIIAIAALFIAVIGLSIGFAAFSSTLTISSSATVTPDASQWKVGFIATAADTLAEPGPDVEGVKHPVTDGAAMPDPTTATISNGATSTDGKGTATITNLHANFTEPGQTVTYDFLVKNESRLPAYLKSIKFDDANGDKTKACVATATDANATQNSASCAGINLTISIVGESTTTRNLNAVGTTSQSISSGHKLDALTGTNAVTVTISYTGEYYFDTPVEVTLPDILLGYDAVPYAS